MPTTLRRALIDPDAVPHLRSDDTRLTEGVDDLSAGVAPPGLYWISHQLEVHSGEARRSPVSSPAIP